LRFLAFDVWRSLKKATMSIAKEKVMYKGTERNNCRLRHIIKRRYNFLTISKPFEPAFDYTNFGFV